MSNEQQDIPLSELEGFESISRIVAGRPLYRFSGVRSFQYFAQRMDELGDEWNEIELVLEVPEPPYEGIGFRFHRVRDISFSGFAQIMGLYFQAIEERGWEKLSFEVGDYENGKIHLYCHRISVFDPGGT